VVDDLQDLDEAEGGPQPPQGRLLIGIQFGHDPGRLPPRRLVAAGPKVQVDPAAPGAQAHRYLGPNRPVAL
jgi:hypothetical protein